MREFSSPDDIQLLPLLIAASSFMPGTFVEIGANDGLIGSQTRLLEKCFGWRGVLIEGDPRSFAKLNQTHRHGSRKVHSAVCEEGQNNITISIIAGPHKCRLPAARCHPVVPCQPLPFIMTQQGFPRVTFLSLDVEGAEQLVLDTVIKHGGTGDAFPFDVVLVEAERHAMQKNLRVRELLRNAGLRQLPLEPSPGSFNDLFVRATVVDPRSRTNPALVRASQADAAWFTPLFASWPHNRSMELELMANRTGLRTATSMLAKRLRLGMPEAFAAFSAAHAASRHAA